MAIGGKRKAADDDSGRTPDRKARRSANRRTLNADEKKRIGTTKHSTRDAGDQRQGR